MSHPTTSTSGSQSSEADLLEKIRLAEIDSAARLESAKKEADAIVARAKEQATVSIQKAEENARKERDRIFSEGKSLIEAEVEKIHADVSQQVNALKQKTEQPEELKQLVLSILEE